MKKWTIRVYMVIIFLFAVCMNGKQIQAADYTSAEALELDEKWTLEYWLTDTNQEQWYKFVVPSDGKLNYKIMSYTSIYYAMYTEDLSKEVASTNGISIGGSETSPKTCSGNCILSKGIYYLKIWPGFNCTGKYKFNISFCSYNVNDDMAISYDLSQRVSIGDSITGAITKTDREDWYSINIVSTGYYYYRISTYGRFYWELYNEDLSKKIASTGGVCTGGSETSPVTVSREYMLSKGIYYLKIFPAYYDTGKYTFQISALNQSNCNHDYESTYFDPTYTSKGYTLHKCSKCGHSYQDNFKSKLGLSKPDIYTLYAGKKKVTVTWSHVSNVSGYEISYKIKKATKTLNIKSGSKTRKTIKKLKSGKKCEVRIRSYKNIGSTTVYSKWSSKKTVKIK